MEKKKYNAPKVKIAVMEKLMQSDGVSTTPSGDGGDSRAKQSSTIDDGTEKTSTSTWDN